MVNRFFTRAAFALMFGLICISAQADGPRPLTKAWELRGFKQPESVVFDTRRHILYVSNIDGEPGNKDGKGTISRVAPSGRTLEAEWISGLNAPKGMAIHGDKLYVADLDTLVVIDLEKGAVQRHHLVSEAKFLNDVAIDRLGNVYVSDFLDNAIYRLTNNRLNLWVKDDRLAAPNGLYAEKDELIVATWGELSGQGFNTTVAGHLFTISLADKTIVSLGQGKPLGNLDGVEADGLGGYFVTDWVAGTLLRIKRDGTSEVMLRLGQGSADLTYIRGAKLLLVPMMSDRKLLAYKVRE